MGLGTKGCLTKNLTVWIFAVSRYFVLWRQWNVFQTTKIFIAREIIRESWPCQISRYFQIILEIWCPILPHIVLLTFLLPNIVQKCFVFQTKLWISPIKLNTGWFLETDIFYAPITQYLKPCFQFLRNFDVQIAKICKMHWK